MDDWIIELLDAARAKLDSIVAQTPWPEKAAVRHMLAPYYKAIDVATVLLYGAGVPDHLRANGEVFADIAGQLRAFSEQTVVNTRLRALEQDATWHDPNASDTYWKEFLLTQGSLDRSVRWTLSLADMLSQEADLVDDYYERLAQWTVDFVFEIGALAAMVPALIASTGLAAIAAGVGAAVSGGKAAVDLFRYPTMEPTALKDVCDGPWPKPVFADY